MGSLITKFNNTTKSDTNKHFYSSEQEINYYKNELNKQQDRIKKMEEMMIKFTKYHSEYDNEVKIEKEKIEKKIINEISKEKIKDFVNNLLTDEDINIIYLPDIVERQIYINILTIILGIVNHSLDDINIKFLEHNLKMSFHPTIPEINETKLVLNMTKDINSPKGN
jgi:hypothetical protein